MRCVWGKLKDKIRYFMYFCKYCFALFLFPFLKKQEKYQGLWIISERGEDARDNGIHLFRYIKKEHPEINIRYIISKDSKDRKQVEEIGEWIAYRSFSHYLALMAAEMKISTHIMGFAPDMYFFKVLDKVFPMKGKKIFLQHGIIKDDLPYLYGDSVSLDLFVCGAKKEWEYVCEVFGHQEGVPQYLGLCRYDRLPHEKKVKPNGIILLMPTWRGYLADQNLSDRQFCKTDYYQCFQHLLDSEKLEALLSKYGFVLKFYPHHEMQKYISCFRTRSEQIEIVDNRKLEVQSALIEADVLLTDYSSVFFDFAYMKKPVLYYQFDQAAFRSGHYQEGYFKYENDGFGAVCCDEGELLRQLETLLEKQCQIEQVYEERIEQFFYVRDQENCKRNFEMIYKLWRGGSSFE